MEEILRCLVGEFDIAGGAAANRDKYDNSRKPIDKAGFVCLEEHCDNGFLCPNSINSFIEKFGSRGDVVRGHKLNCSSVMV